MTIHKAKEAVAGCRGYSSWEEYYNWVARPGQFPEVVAQLIEAAMEDVIIILTTPEQ